MSNKDLRRRPLPPDANGAVDIEAIAQAKAAMEQHLEKFSVTGGPMDPCVIPLPHGRIAWDGAHLCDHIAAAYMAGRWGSTSSTDIAREAARVGVEYVKERHRLVNQEIAESRKAREEAEKAAAEPKVEIVRE